MIKRTLATLGIAALLYGCSSHNSKNIETTIVPQAQLVYSEKPINSEGFWNCTAVIMDYGNKAVFAHAWPSVGEFLPDSLNNEYNRKGYPIITIDNAVDEIEKEAKRKGLVGGEATVFGYAQETRYVVKSLKEKGIRIRKVVTREAIGKEKGGVDVFYDPAKDYLEITNSSNN